MYYMYAITFMERNGHAGMRENGMCRMDGEERHFPRTASEDSRERSAGAGR